MRYCSLEESSAINEAERAIVKSIHEISTPLERIVDIRNSIELLHIVHNVGLDADLRSRIKKDTQDAIHSSSGNASDSPADYSASNNSDYEQCKICNFWLPYQALPFHDEAVHGEESYIDELPPTVPGNPSNLQHGSNSSADSGPMAPKQQKGMGQARTSRKLGKDHPDTLTSAEQTEPKLARNNSGDTGPLYAETKQLDHLESRNTLSGDSGDSPPSQSGVGSILTAQGRKALDIQKIRLCAQLAEFAYASGDPQLKILTDDQLAKQTLSTQLAKFSSRPEIIGFRRFYSKPWLPWFIPKQDKFKWFRSYAYFCHYKTAENVDRIVVGFRGTWNNSSGTGVYFADNGT